MQSAEYQKFQEFAVALSNVDLTELGLLARDTVVCDPERKPVESLNRVIDSFLQDLWNRLQIPTEQRREKAHQLVVEQFKMSMLMETLQAFSDTDLKSYARAARAGMLRTADSYEAARYRSNRKTCLSIMKARVAVRRMLSSFVGTRIE